MLTIFIIYYASKVKEMNIFTAAYSPKDVSKNVSDGVQRKVTIESYLHHHEKLQMEKYEGYPPAPKNRTNYANWSFALAVK